MLNREAGHRQGGAGLLPMEGGMDERFLRNEMMLGPEAVEKLASVHVCVFGLGGVGG